MEDSQRNKMRSDTACADFIYDKNGFIDWTVNKQGKTRSTAESYLSSIRTVFKTEFDLDYDNPFSNLRNAFAKTKENFKEEIDMLEFEYRSFVGYIEIVEEYSDFILTENCESRIAPKEMWLTALKTYKRYIRWKIDRLRQLNGLPIEVEDDASTFIDLPFGKEYRYYLDTLGHGYSDTSINTIVSRLRRFYNLFLRRVMKFDGLPDLGFYIEQGEPVNLLLDKIESMIDFESNGHLVPKMNKEDFSRGKKAFTLYKDFISDFRLNPNKYKILRSTEYSTKNKRL